MKITNGEIHDAGVALAAIFNRPRNIPQMAKFKLARMHKSINKIADALELQRVELVKELGAEQKNAEGKSEGWAVPDEHIAEYRRRWEEIRAQEVTVNIETISLASLGESPQGIEAHEFRMLDQFVTE